MELAETGKYGVTSLRVQSRRRLIEHQHLRSHRYYTCDSYAALLPSRQIKGRSLPQLLVHSRQRECLSGPLRTFRIRKALILRSELHISDDVRLEELILGILEDQSDLPAQLPHIVAVGIYVLAVYIYPTARRPQQTVQVLDQSRLAGAGASDDADELMISYLEAHIPQRMVLHRGAGGVYVVEVFDLDSHLLSTYCGHQLIHRKYPLRYIQSIGAEHIGQLRDLRYVQPQLAYPLAL